MPVTELQFSRDLDLPPGIVWDALVDDVLVDGWLAPAAIEPRLHGAYQLSWPGKTLAATNGVITEFSPVTRLSVETDNIGNLEFSLSAVAGGARGARTLLVLRLQVDTEPRMLASTKANWRSNFDQLEDLLRGHPVDWSTWQRDRGEVWSEYLWQAAHE